MAKPTSYKKRKTPGVYITELDAFPPSVIGVETAVPAFIGYTQTAAISGKPVLNQPIKIGSLADYEDIFGKGFKPVYDITVLDPTADKQQIGAGDFDFKVYDSTAASWLYYDLVQVTETKFNLYDSMRLFYANGGGNCYVVSVGLYRTEEGGAPVSVSRTNLEAGLAAIKEQVGPTMLVIPDAVLLPPTSPTAPPFRSADFQSVIHEMLTQCGELQDRVAILDVYGTDSIGTTYGDPKTPKLVSLDDVVDQFRVDVGDTFLSYGMAYFPFLHTSVVSLSEIVYTNLNISDSTSQGAGKLQGVLTMEATNLYPGGDEDPRFVAAKQEIDTILPTDTTPESQEKVIQLNKNLTAAIPFLLEMERVIMKKNDVLPPSGAMAGVYTLIDGTRGVWNAPANISLSAVSSPTFTLNDQQQGDLNLPVDGKAIDALREFVGKGTVVWGARTLDGNSNDWRYIQVRRTLVYIEQSIKNALDQFIFAGNDSKTWVTVVSMVSGFLQGLWSQGGLMGATASEAYSVECGLGSTMTAQDVLDGYMIVQVRLQMIRPAEFIELSFKQKVEG